MLFSKFTPLRWAGTFEVFAQDSSVGDLNGDGKINSIDIVLLFSNFNVSLSASDPGNLDKVTSEALLLLTDWGKTKDDRTVSMDGEGVFLPPPPGTTDEEIMAEKLYQVEVTEKNYEDYMRNYNAWLSSDDSLAKQTVSNPVPGYYESSEFLIGKVAVAIILPESNGVGDPSTEDWTVDEVDIVKNEIIDATNWWIARESRAPLKFVYEWYTINDITPGLLETSVEPITRPHGDQRLWINDVLGNLGYTANSYFTKVRDFNNDLREKHGTDWAFTIFVVDSSNDADNKFAAECYWDPVLEREVCHYYFAYAYLGGPFLVMTSSNNGYGLGNMDAVTAHEMGHIFRALDQYYKAGQRCTWRSGYLYVENQNSQYPCSGCCDINESSIMRGLTSPYRQGIVDHYARGQVGWWDQDSNDILDPIDTELEIVFNPPEEDGGGNIIYYGSVEEIPYPSPSRRDVTINKIISVQYWVDGISGGWTDAAPKDGNFDSYKEEFAFTADPIDGDTVTFIQVKVIDNFGTQRIFSCDGNLSCVLLPPPRSGCLESGGAWREFGNACADKCSVVRSDEPPMCAQVLTWSCDCGPDECWDEGASSCEPNDFSYGSVDGTTWVFAGGTLQRHGSVDVSFYQGESIAASTTSDTRGYYQLLDVETGTYTVTGRVFYGDYWYSGTMTNVIVNSEQNTRVTLLLLPE